MPHAVLAILPPQYGLEVLDGWRPLAVQRALRESFRHDIVVRHPEYDAAQIEEKLDQFVADPERTGITPPHHTGGSVDLTLFDTASGRTLDMGTAFDEPSHRSHSHALELEPPQAAQTHRRLLVNSMLLAGFSNLPTEWWHFDYGNALWAVGTGAEAAVFGAAHWP